MHGVYLPYWTFDAQVGARYTAEAGTYFKNNQNKQEIRWRSVSGRIDHFFDDTLVCASHGVHPQLVRAVEPFPTTSDRLKPYDPGYLSGWTVERYQLDLVAAAQQGRQRMLDAARQMCADAIQAVINGATGQVAGEHPWSWVKIGFAALALALVGLVMLWLDGR